MYAAALSHDIEPGQARLLTGVEAGVYAPVLCMVEYDISEEASACVTDYRGVRLRNIDVFRYEGRGLHRGDRKSCHIDADHMDDYLVSIPLNAKIEFSQEGHEGHLLPGEFALLSTSRPFLAAVSGLRECDIFSALHVRIAGSILREHIPQVDEYCDRPIRLKAGTGVIMRSMCELAIEQGRLLSFAQANRFGAMLIGAVAAAASEAAEMSSLPRPLCSAHQRILRQARDFIEEQLGNPGLDTTLIAQHCRVSKRYLQGVFAESGETATALIRELRLQRCREDLRDPGLSRRSVAQIAMQWGFNDLPYFSRAYRARFDRPPSKDRGGD